MNAAIKRSAYNLAMITLCSIPVFTLGGKPFLPNQHGKISDWECVAGPNEDWQCKKEGNDKNKYSLEKITLPSAQITTPATTINTSSSWQCMSSGADQDWICQTRSDDEHQQSLENVTLETLSKVDKEKNISPEAASNQTNALALLRQEIRVLTKALESMKHQNIKTIELADQPKITAEKTTKSAIIIAESAIADSVDKDDNRADVVDKTPLNVEKNVSEKNPAQLFSINKTLLEIEKTILQKSKTERKAPDSKIIAETQHQKEPVGKNSHKNMHAARTDHSLTRNIFSPPPAEEIQILENIADTGIQEKNNSAQRSHPLPPAFKEPLQTAHKISRSSSRNSIALQLMAEQMNSEPLAEIEAAETIKNNSKQNFWKQPKQQLEPDVDTLNNEYQRGKQKNVTRSSPHYQPAIDNTAVQTTRNSRSAQPLSQESYNKNTLFHHDHHSQIDVPENTPKKYHPASRHSARQVFSEYDQEDQYQKRDNFTKRNSENLTEKPSFKNNNTQPLSQESYNKSTLFHHDQHSQTDVPENTPEKYHQAPSHSSRQVFSEYDQEDQYQKRDNFTKRNPENLTRKPSFKNNSAQQQLPLTTSYHVKRYRQQPQAMSTRDIMRQRGAHINESSVFSNEREEKQTFSEIKQPDYLLSSKENTYDRLDMKVQQEEESSSDRLRIKTQRVETYNRNSKLADNSSDTDTDTDQLPMEPDFSRMEERDDRFTEASESPKSKPLSFQNAPPDHFTLQWASATDKDMLEQLKLRYPLLAQATIIVSQTDEQKKYMLVNGLFQTMRTALVSLQQEPWRHLATLLNPWARTMGSFDMFSVQEKQKDLSIPGLPQGGYTIQWATSPNMEYLNALVRTYRQLASAKIIRLTMRQQTQYLLTEGVYPDRLAALDAISVPELKTIAQQLQPKARPAASLQNAEIMQQSQTAPVATRNRQADLNKYTIQWIASGDPSMLSWVQQHYHALKNAVMISENGRYLLIQGSFDDKITANKMLSHPKFQQVTAALSPTIRPVSEIKLANKLNMF